VAGGGSTSRSAEKWGRVPMASKSTSSVPSGARRPQARSSAEFDEPVLRLPETPQTRIEGMAQDSRSASASAAAALQQRVAVSVEVLEHRLETEGLLLRRLGEDHAASLEVLIGLATVVGVENGSGVLAHQV